MKIFIAVLSIFFITKATCYCQEYSYNHYDIKDGLSGLTVYSIVQDKDGFLWFATETGLSRFDGTHFKNYSENDGLPDNEIINLFVDSKNRVWIMPFKNALCYYYQGKIYNQENDKVLKKLNLKNDIYKAGEDNHGNLIFLENNAVHILYSNDSITTINKISNQKIFVEGCGTLPDGYGCIFISNPQDLESHEVKMLKVTNTGLKFFTKLHDHSLNRKSIEINPDYSIVRDSLSFTITNYKYQYSYKTKAPANFYTMSYLNDSSFAISTFNKTLLFNINQRKITDSFLSHTIVNKCLQDNAGNMWFATRGFGIYSLSSKRVQVFKLRDNANDLTVYALNKANDKIYIGASHSTLWNLSHNNSFLTERDINNNYAIDKISYLNAIDSNKILVGSDNGFFELNKQSIYNYSFPTISVKSVYKYDDSLLIVTDRIVYKTKIDQYKKVDTVWKGRSTCACKLNNNYYIGTLDGLYKISNNTSVNLGDTFSFLKDKIQCLVTTPSGNLWIGTSNYGLLCLKNNKVIYHINEKNGLTSNNCRCLFLNNNTLWLGTDKGISKIYIKNNLFHITRYTSADGLDCEIINCILASGDSVYAGTPFGLTFFNANQPTNLLSCRLKILDIQSQKKDWYQKQDNIVLSSDDKIIKIDYTAISFATDEDITYYYRLIGLDSSWTATNENTVDFELLPPGKYEFKIYAVNKYGIRSNTINIPFEKERTIYQKLWFKAIIALLLLALIALFIFKRTQVIRTKANEKIARERQINELEQMALRSQMNPHFIFNSLNSIQQYVFQGDFKEANRFITTFSSLIRQTLDISAKKFITLEEEIAYLNAYITIEHARFENQFNFKIDIDDSVSVQNIILPPLLLQPFVENSLRHGVLLIKDGKGLIVISFKIEDECLTCKVTDNGLGIHTSKKLKSYSSVKHESKGMSIVEKRVEGLNALYKNKIAIFIEQIEEQGKTGTVVTLKLPLHYNETGI